MRANLAPPKLSAQQTADQTEGQDGLSAACCGVPPCRHFDQAKLARGAWSLALDLVFGRDAAVQKRSVAENPLGPDQGSDPLDESAGMRLHPQVPSSHPIVEATVAASVEITIPNR